MSARGKCKVGAIIEPLARLNRRALQQRQLAHKVHPVESAQQDSEGSRNSKIDEPSDAERFIEAQNRVERNRQHGHHRQRDVSKNKRSKQNCE